MLRNEISMNGTAENISYLEPFLFGLIGSIVGMIVFRLIKHHNR
jgi:type II secretory pathway component PulF